MKEWRLLVAPAILLAACSGPARPFTAEEIKKMCEVGQQQIDYNAQNDLLAGFDSDNGNFYVALRREDGNYENLSSNNYSESTPAFSPDKKTIAFGRDGLFWGHKKTDLGNNGIYTMDAHTGKNVKRLSNAPPGYADHSPIWSPDGNRIMFQRDHNNTSGILDSLDYYVVDKDGSNLLLAVPFDLSKGEPSFDEKPQFSPDGNKIAFLYYKNEGKSSKNPELTYVVDLQKGTLTQVSQDISLYDPAQEVEVSSFDLRFYWSENSDQLLILKHLDGDPNITASFMVNSDGTQFTDATFFCNRPDSIINYPEE